jgi:hypothetical protein
MENRTKQEACVLGTKGVEVSGKGHDFHGNSQPLPSFDRVARQQSPAEYGAYLGCWRCQVFGGSMVIGVEKDATPEGRVEVWQPRLLAFQESRHAFISRPIRAPGQGSSQRIRPNSISRDDSLAFQSARYGYVAFPARCAVEELSILRDGLDRPHQGDESEGS